MGRNKTIYVKAENLSTWERGKKLLAFHEGKSLSDFIADQLRGVVEKYEPRT
jgi:hypothetical protein